MEKHLRVSSSNLRIYQGLILGACVVIGIIFRLLNYQFVLAPLSGHLNFIDPDSYYHLRRLAAFLTNFPNSMTFDPLSDWPHGAQVDWPEGFLWILGVPLKLIGVHSFRSLEFGVSFMVLLLGLFIFLLNDLLAKIFFQKFWMRVMVLFFTATNFLLIRYSFFGQVSHHAVEELLPPLFLFLLLNTFGNRGIWRSILLGILLTFSVLVSSSSLFVIFAVFACYGFFIGNRENILKFLWMSASFMVTLGLAALWEFLRRGHFQAMNYPSGFHLALGSLFVISALSLVLFRRQSLIVFAGLLIGFSFLLLIGWPEVLMAPLKSAALYVFARGGALQNITEAFPIFLDAGGFNFNFVNVNFGYLIYLLPLAWFLIFKKSLSIQERCLFLMLGILSIPAIAQKRFSHLMVCLFIIFSVWLFRASLFFVQRKNLRIQAWIVILFLGLTILPFPGGKLSYSASPRMELDLKAASSLLEKAEIKADEAWKRLGGALEVREGIWLNPNMGHLFLYLTGLGVTSNTYFHASSFALDFKVRQIESEEQLRKALIENKIRFLVLADDWKYFEILYKVHGFSANGIVEHRIINGEDVVDYNFLGLRKFAWARMITDESPVKGFDSLFSIMSKDSHFYHFVRGYKLTP